MVLVIFLWICFAIETKAILIVSQKYPSLTINESSIVCVKPQLVKLSKLWSTAKVRL